MFFMVVLVTLALKCIFIIYIIIYIIIHLYYVYIYILFKYEIVYNLYCKIILEMKKIFFFVSKCQK